MSEKTKPRCFRCNIEITFDKNVLKANGRMAPLDVETKEIHVCNPQDIGAFESIKAQGELSEVNGATQQREPIVQAKQDLAQTQKNREAINRNSQYRIKVIEATDKAVFEGLCNAYANKARDLGGNPLGSQVIGFLNMHGTTTYLAFIHFDIPNKALVEMNQI